MNKKRETIRRPVDREAVPDWDDQDRRIPPPKQAKGPKHRSEEEDMILDKDDD